MTKRAHITSRPEHKVGDRVLGLCGKEFKVKVLWADLPVEKPICRGCVDTAVTALTEADQLIELARVRMITLLLQASRLDKQLSPDEGTLLDQLAAEDREHRKVQEEDIATKALEERLKQTCTCTWTSPEIFTEDPNCPIHGGELDAIPVDREIQDTELPEPTASDFSGVQGVEESDIRKEGQE